MRWLRRTLTWAVYARRVGRRWAGPLADNAIWPLDGATVDGQGALHVLGLGVALAKPDALTLMLLRARRFAIGLHQRAAASFEIREGEIVLTLGSVRLAASCESDFSVIHEVFVERLYSFESAGPFLVIDVGANIGASSLFFADTYDAKVVAFELVPSTAEIAERNIARNPDLARKITLNRYGLTDRGFDTEIPASVAYRPSNSLYLALPKPGSATERVEARDIGAVLPELLKTLGSRKLVVKIDAEGAEYEILHRLAEAKLLDRIDMLFLEWHRREGHDPEELRRTLREAGFRWFEQGHMEEPVGMIEAYRP